MLAALERMRIGQRRTSFKLLYVMILKRKLWFLRRF